MGKLTRTFDWSYTSLGNPDQWPQSLRITVSNMLRSKFPMFLWWGEEMIQFYNDAYRPSLGTSGKHPSALGAKGKETWPEIWDIISPLMRQVETTGEATWMENQLVPIYRNGKIEDVYWTYSYSSVLDDNGNHGGILVTCMETTETVIGHQKIERSQQELLQLFEESPVAIAKISRDDDLVFEYANSFYGVIVGRKPGEIIGKPLLEALPEIKGQGFDNLLKEVVRTAKPYIANEVPVSIFRNNDIEVIFVNLAYQPRIDTTGAIEGILVVATDVTEQVRSRKGIEESEAKYRTLFEAMDQGYCTLEVLFEGEKCVNYRYLETNPTFEKHLGMTNALGKTIRDIAPDIEPKWFDFYGGVALTGEAIHIEEESKAFNKWFKVYAIRVGDPGERKIGVFFTDITEPKRAEEVLRESETRFRNLVEHAPVAIAIFRGPQHIIELANEEHLKLWGRTAEQVIGLPLFEALPEAAGHGYEKMLDSVLTTGKAFRADELYTDLMRNDKLERVYFNFVYQALREENGSISGVIVAATEVTDRMEAKFKLLESEAKFRTMAESTPVLISVGDETGKVSYFNKAWTDLTGRPMQDLLQTGWTDFMHPEDKELFAQVFNDAFLLKDAFTAEFRVLDAAGEQRWLLADVAPRFDSEGNFMGYISACTDITENKINQQHLETALEQVRLSKEAAELGTFDLDLEKGTMHWDDRCRTLFGISHHGPVTYEKDFVQGLHPDDKERISKVIDDLFVKSFSNGDYDVEYRTVGAEDGVIRWIRAKGKVYFNTQDKPVRFIGSVLDITEKVTAIQKIERLVEERTKELAQVNESLLQTNKELQRSNANLEEFTYAASHDLKEPIRKITIFTSQLRTQLTDRLGENENRVFDRIQNATERMGNLIDDLLLYSHVTQRPQETELTHLDQRIQRVLEDLELDIEEKGATFHVAKLPVVKGYRRQLQQLFQNLISNALKYSKTNEAPHISISATEAAESGKPYHIITIKDNGIGFDERYADKIFQLFNRLHGKSEYSGTGVGLSIVKKVVENHNGFIRVESLPGVGSTFHIYLPLN